MSPETDQRITDDWYIGVRGCDFLLPRPSHHHPDHVAVSRMIHSYSPMLEPFIEHMRRLAADLIDPSILLVSDDDQDGGVLFICGDRPITDHDRQRLAAREVAKDARERAEYERLAAKFGAAEDGRNPGNEPGNESEKP